MRHESILGVALLVLFSSEIAAQGSLTRALTAAADPFSAEGEQAAGGGQAPPAVATAPAEPHERELMNINRSPVSSVFGFYVGGQKGNTVSVATSFYF